MSDEVGVFDLVAVCDGFGENVGVCDELGGTPMAETSIRY